MSTRYSEHPMWVALNKEYDLDAKDYEVEACGVSLGCLLSKSTCCLSAWSMQRALV